jgi:hypothetical protein
MKQLLTLIAILGTHTLSQAQISAIDNNRLPQDNHWTYFSGRYEMTVKSGDQVIPATINLRMKRDSIVWFTISANMGIQIQVAKGVLLRDTLHLADIYHKEYYVVPVAYASQYLSMPIGVKQIQNLFTGQPLVDTCNTGNIQKDASANYVYYTTMVEPLLIKSYYGYPGQTPQTKLDNEGYSQLRITEISSPNNAKDKATLEHNQWLDVSKESNGAFTTLPMELKITTTTAQQTAQVDLALTTARYDAIPSYPFKIDDSYKLQPLPSK